MSVRLSAAFVSLFLLSSLAIAQQPESTQSARLSAPVKSVPRLIKFSGQIKDADGRPKTGPAGLTFSLYAEQNSASPLYLETQSVTLDENGRYTVTLGSTSASGLPMDLFSKVDANWLGVRLNEEGAQELPRVMLVSVPYALSAGSAENTAMLDGRPATDYVLTPSAQAATAGGEVYGTGDNGTQNRLAKFSATGSNIGLIDSAITEVNGRLGIATATPQASMEVVGSANVAIFRAPIPTAYVGFRLWNDQNDPFRAMELNYAGSAFAGPIVANGISGEGGSIGTTGVQPMHIATNNTARITVTGGGLVGIGINNPTSLLESSSATLTQTVKFANTNGIGATSYSVSTPPPTALRAEATAAVGQNAGVIGSAASGAGIGVVGQNIGNSGNAIGLLGVSALSGNGTAVWGESLATAGDAVGVFGRSTSSAGTGVFGLADVATGDAVGVFGRSLAAGGTGVWGEVTAASGTNYGVYGRVSTANTTSSAGTFDTTSNANILIGRAGANPVNVFRVDSTGKGFFNGTTQTGGADFAESVAVREEKSEYQPGDVISIDTEGVRRFTKVSKPYSTLVAGIYSTKPGILATPHDINSAKPETEEIPLAVVGIVPCKVTSENGPIHAGDLLVSSSTAGYAMKGTDRDRMNGAVIGKALQPMNGNTGVIEVLVSLQ